VKLTWRKEWPAWVLLAGVWLVALWAWPGAPDRIPSHWGLSGEPNGWSGRGILFLIPAFAIFIYLLTIVLPRIDPARASYPKFAGAYTVIRFGALAVMLGIEVIVVLVSRGVPVRVDIATMALGGAYFILIGSVFHRLEPNWVAGIRTPWTLTSHAAWKRAHRLGGYVMMLGGVLLLAAAFIARPWAVVMAIVVTMIGILAVIVDSYFTWRADPDKTPPPGLTRAPAS
jgi:uncharacterized membrane protein